jgi:uncharacterized membrane protein
MLQQLKSDEGKLLLLTPNRSLSWRGNLWIITGLFLVSLCVVTGMALMGAWVVLPFAGLELTALFIGLYYTARNCHRQEVLVITPETLRLEKGIYRKQVEWELPRRYTRVQVHPPRHRMTPSKLSLMHRDTEIPLAPFLNMDDTQALLSFLEGQGLRIVKIRPGVDVYWF